MGFRVLYNDRCWVSPLNRSSAELWVLPGFLPEGSVSIRANVLLELQYPGKRDPVTGGNKQVADFVTDAYQEMPWHLRTAEPLNKSGEFKALEVRVPVEVEPTFNQYAVLGLVGEVRQIMSRAEELNSLWQQVEQAMFYLSNRFWDAGWFANNKTYYSVGPKSDLPLWMVQLMEKNRRIDVKRDYLDLRD